MEPRISELPNIYIVRDSTASLLSKLSEYVNGQGVRPALVSPAAAERSRFPNPQSIDTVCSQVAQLVEVAADHLSLFQKALSEPLETIAPWTCVRAVLESSAIALWLLQPTLDAKSRVGRSLALRYEGMEQQRKFIQLSDPAEAKHLANRILEVETQAAGWGFAPLRSRQKRSGIGQVMPQITTLVRESLNQEAMYRLLSAVAHAHSWAVLALSFTPVDPEEHPIPSNPGWLHPHMKVVDVVALAQLGRLGAKVMARLAWDQAQYYGWDTALLRSHVSGCLDSLELPEASRPWFTRA